MGKIISVAIDGPSGAGKSSVAKEIAKRFQFTYVDTGAMYRTVGLAAQYKNIGSKDTSAVIDMLPSVFIDINYDATGLQRMFLNGKDVTDEIRTPISSIYASDVSAIPEVRLFLMEKQRAMSKMKSVIMDGRDIGTVVLPMADLKIFMTASAEERAKRRFLELKEKGSTASFEEVLADIEYRDNQDSSREVAPLRPADDAILLDTTSLSFEQSVDAVSNLIREKLADENSSPCE